MIMSVSKQVQKLIVGAVSPPRFWHRIAPLHDRGEDTAPTIAMEFD